MEVLHFTSYIFSSILEKWAQKYNLRQKIRCTTEIRYKIAHSFQLIKSRIISEYFLTCSPGASPHARLGSLSNTVIQVEDHEVSWDGGDEEKREEEEKRHFWKAVVVTTIKVVIGTELVALSVRDRGVPTWQSPRDNDLFDWQLLFLFFHFYCFLIPTFIQPTANCFYNRGVSRLSDILHLVEYCVWCQNDNRPHWFPLSKKTKAKRCEESIGISCDFLKVVNYNSAEV